MLAGSHRRSTSKKSDKAPCSRAAAMARAREDEGDHCPDPNPLVTRSLRHVDALVGKFESRDHAPRDNGRNRRTVEQLGLQPSRSWRRSRSRRSVSQASSSATSPPRKRWAYATWSTMRNQPSMSPCSSPISRADQPLAAGIVPAEDRQTKPHERCDVRGDRSVLRRLRRHRLRRLHRHHRLPIRRRCHRYPSHQRRCRG